MVLYTSKGHLPTNDLHILKDACLALLDPTGTATDGTTTGTWCTTVKHYRCITPRTVDERAPPGTDDADEDSRTITVSTCYDGDDVSNRLVSAKGSEIAVNGDIQEFMERCFPDYRLRAEVRAQGWSVVIGGGGGGCVRGGVMSMGSQSMGICLEVTGDPIVDYIVLQLKPVIEDHFTPVPTESLSAISEYLRHRLASTR